MKTIIKILLLIISLIVLNCTTVEEKLITSGSLNIEQPKMNVNITPYKIKADFSNESITSTLNRDYFFGISNDEGTNESFYRRTLSFFINIPLPITDVLFFPFPTMKKFRRDVNDFIAGDKNIIETAIAKAIRENNADGIYLTNIIVSDKGFLWIWNREATIQGKIIKFSPSK